jgi:hypothetical protein
MRAIILMFDSLNRHMLSPYAADTIVQAPTPVCRWAGCVSPLGHAVPSTAGNP